MTNKLELMAVMHNYTYPRESIGGGGGDGFTNNDG